MIWYYWWFEAWRLGTQMAMVPYIHAGTGVYGKRPSREVEEYMVGEMRRDLEELGVEGLKRGI